MNKEEIQSGRKCTAYFLYFCEYFFSYDKQLYDSKNNKMVNGISVWRTLDMKTISHIFRLILNCFT